MPTAPPRYTSRLASQLPRPTYLHSITTPSTLTLTPPSLQSQHYRLSKMDLAAPVMVAARATSTLIASHTSYADPTPSPSLSDGHKLFHHGASPTDSGSGGSGGEGQGECKLLGSFSLLIQLALGGLALLSLVYKRWRERPQRPLKVWAFDVSKQVFGSCMLHLLNLLLSMFSAGQIEIRPQYRPNPCSFYLLNLGIDVSIAPTRQTENTSHAV